MQYILKLEGQELPLTAEIAATDQTIIAAIAPFFPEAASAEIKREQNGETTIIRLVKKAGTKGNYLENIINVTNELNPSIALSWQLKQMEIRGELTLERLLKIQPLLENAISEGESWEFEINRVISCLKACQPIASKQPIKGY